MDPLSAHHPLLKHIRRAVSHGTLTEDGYIVAEGPHLLDEARAAKCEIGAVLLAESNWTQHSAHYANDEYAHGLRMVSDKVFQQISSTETPQGVLALVRPPSYSLDQVIVEEANGKPALIVILDGIQDPGNAGAILRAAEAFGGTGVVFLKGTVNPYNPKCLRGSAGSVFRLPIVTAIEETVLLAALSKHPLEIYATLPHAGRLLSETNLSSACAIVIGSEGRGVSAGLAARSTGLRIPTSGVESLNASVAAGIVLYESRRQRNESGRSR